MVKVGKVQGSEEMAIPVYVGKSRVDVHSNITHVEPKEGIDPENPYDEGDYYEYDEIQYTRDEYAQKQALDVINHEDALAELDSANDDRLAAIEDAICELDKKYNGGAE